MSENTIPELQMRLKWLLFFRAIVMSILLVIPIFIQSNGPFDKIKIVIYVSCGIGYGMILSGALWMRRFGSRGLISLSYIQLISDCILASLLVYATGGVESAFVFLFSIAILNASVLLRRQSAFIVALSASIIYGLVFLLEITGIILPIGIEKTPEIASILQSFLLNQASFFIIAFLSGSLTEQLRHTSESLRVARAQIADWQILYEAVLSSLPSGILTLDNHGKLIFVNRAGREILGIKPKKTSQYEKNNNDKKQHVDDDMYYVDEDCPEVEIFRHLKETSAKNYRKLAKEKSENLESDTTYESRENREIRENREERFELVTDDHKIIGGNISDLTGIRQFPGHVVIFQDLTELRKLQKQAATSEKMSSLGRFAAGLAHEIRNPLAAMIGCLQLLDSEALKNDPDSARLLQIVQREAERLSKLVSDFLTYARPSPPQRLTFSVQKLVRDTVMVATQNALLRQNQIELRIEIDEKSEEAYAIGDPEQVRQALWNLLSNAIHILHETRERQPEVYRDQTRRLEPNPSLLSDNRKDSASATSSAPSTNQPTNRSTNQPTSIPLPTPASNPPPNPSPTNSDVRSTNAPSSPIAPTNLNDDKATTHPQQPLCNLIVCSISRLEDAEGSEKIEKTEKGEKLEGANPSSFARHEQNRASSTDDKDDTTSKSRKSIDADHKIGTSTSKTVVIAVEDNGPGVPADVASRLFEPFFTTRAKGTGLGLATSHQLLTAQGGNLLLTTTTLGGARFEIHLPLVDEKEHSTPKNA